MHIAFRFAARSLRPAVLIRNGPVSCLVLQLSGWGWGGGGALGLGGGMGRPYVRSALVFSAVHALLASAMTDRTLVVASCSILLSKMVLGQQKEVQNYVRWER